MARWNVQLVNWQRLHSCILICWFVVMVELLVREVKSFIYKARLKTTGVDPKCFPVETDGLTIQVHANKKNKEYLLKTVLREKTRK